jgi:hypothetical protein
MARQALRDGKVNGLIMCVTSPLAGVSTQAHRNESALRSYGGAETVAGRPNKVARRRWCWTSKPSEVNDCKLVYPCRLRPRPRGMDTR